MMWHLKNIPKIVHFYWGNNDLPYLRYVSITSFIHYNPEWKVVLWTSSQNNANIAVSGHKYIPKCENFLEKLHNLPIEIREIDVTTWGLMSNISEVHKSNIANYFALSTDGGCWSDMDILYFRPIDELLINSVDNASIELAVCVGNYGHSGGFYLASSNNIYFKKLLSLCKQEYKPNSYQCIGPDLCNKYFGNIDRIKPLTTVVNMGMESLYAHDAYHISSIINGSPALFGRGSIGLHWYGGHIQWNDYFKKTNGGLITTQNNVLNNLLKKLNTNSMLRDNTKISVVMAYYNRQSLLNKTIETIKKTSDTNYEIIIIDDGSDSPVVCKEAKIVRINKSEKWWTNPCVPFNMGFNYAEGGIIIIQNPECIYNGDIITYVRNNIKHNTYLSFACYAINKKETDSLEIEGVALNDFPFNSNTGNGWYNHSVYRPMGYHFCSAIMRQDLNMIGGFDERYASGISYDDDDFIRSIKKIGMDIKLVDDPYVLHQFHSKMAYDYPNMSVLHAKNKKLFEDKYNPPMAVRPSPIRGRHVSKRPFSITQRISHREIKQLRKNKIKRGHAI